MAALRKATAFLPEIEARIGLTIAIFCAGAPTLEGTERLLDRLGVPKGQPVTQLRYRGEGWPGSMQARWREGGAGKVSDSISYAAGWGEVLQSHRRWRCRVCDDHTGALADISVGDPWHNPPKDGNEPGRSLIVARTARGRAAVEAAIAAGVLTATPRSRDIIAASQPNLLDTNAHVWGRRAAMRLAGVPVPRAQPASRLGAWLRRLHGMDKLRSILGTWRRLRRDRTGRPVILSPLTDPFAAK
jgi:coenzyme F420 hydrogenase subunit beta